MKRLQCNFWLKALSLVLCCVFAGFLTWSTFYTAIVCNDYDVTATDEQIMRNLGENYKYQIANYMVLSLYNEKGLLTKAGKAELASLRKELDENETNFRFQVTETDSSEVLLSNLEGKTLTNVVQDKKTYQRNFTPVNSGFIDYQYGWDYVGDPEEAATAAVAEEEVDSATGEISVPTQPTENTTDTPSEDAVEAAIEAAYADPDSLNGYYVNSSFVQSPELDPFSMGRKITDDWGTDGWAETAYTLTWGVAKTQVTKDEFTTYPAEAANARATFRQMAPIILISGVLTLATGFWLLYACGHKEGENGIYLCALHRAPYELILIMESILAFIVCVCGVFGYEFLPRDAEGLENPMAMAIYIGCFAGVCMLLASPIATAFVTQIKAGELLKRSLICRFFRFCWHFVLDLLHGIRLFWKAALVYLVFMGVFGFLSLIAFSGPDGLSMLLIMLLVAVGFVALLWWLRGWERVRKGTEHIADGDLTYQIDTQKLPWDLAKQAASLNAISGGMEKAVAERMKSDRFRTELITNVSHDLKTPLTSIISYVDLLKKLNIEDQPAAEYIDVLDRKSQRLKALTEDLVEASKAATGVLPVTFEKLEVNQLVQQSLGEYEERLAGAGLTLCTRLLPEPAWIRADGRHLWRVLDNLLGNCVKYAMPGTRVYLDLEDRDNAVTISLKNISAQPLNIPPEELLERFVRGDENRTTEGSGLGLSIAQSLCTLQGGEFALSTDGDLFKVAVTFGKTK